VTEIDHQVAYLAGASNTLDAMIFDQKHNAMTTPDLAARFADVFNQAIGLGVTDANGSVTNLVFLLASAVQRLAIAG